MNYFTLLSLFIVFFLFGSNSHATNQQVETAGSKIVDQGNTGLAHLQKLTEVEPMKSAIEKCKTADPNLSRDNLIKCAWDNDVSLDDTKKKQVFAMLKSNPDKAESNEYSPDLANFKTIKSSASKVLEKYLMNKLEQALYGDNPGKSTLKIAADHTDFYRLYQSKLGQTLISELSAFCIYSDPTTGDVPFTDEDKLKDNKKNNLSNLKSLDASGKSSAAYTGYSQCIGRISNWCEKGKSFPNDINASAPCELNRLMTSVKIALKQTQSLVKTFKNTKAKHSQHWQAINPNSGKAIINTKLNIDKVTNIGSKELIKDSGYQAEKLKEAKEIKKNCADIDSAEKNPICKKYLTKKSDNDKLLLEFELRNKALAAKVEDKLGATPSEKNLKAVLKEQGLSDTEYANLKKQVQTGLANNTITTCSTVEECIKNKITARMDNEKKQLVASLQKKLKQTQYDDTNQQNTTSAGNTLSALANNYKNSPEALAHVYQYSNIVSSFIKIGKKDSGKRNTAALAAELNSNYFDPNSSGRQTASNQNSSPPPSATVNLSALKPLGNAEDDTSKTFLDSSEINQIQGWTTDPKATPAPNH